MQAQLLRKKRLLFLSILLDVGSQDYHSILRLRSFHLINVLVQRFVLFWVLLEWQTKLCRWVLKIRIFILHRLWCLLVIWWRWRHFSTRWPTSQLEQSMKLVRFHRWPCWVCKHEFWLCVLQVARHYRRGCFRFMSRWRDGASCHFCWGQECLRF